MADDLIGVAGSFGDHPPDHHRRLIPVTIVQIATGYVSVTENGLLVLIKDRSFTVADCRTEVRGVQVCEIFLLCHLFCKIAFRVHFSIAVHARVIKRSPCAWRLMQVYRYVVNRGVVDLLEFIRVYLHIIYECLYSLYSLVFFNIGQMTSHIYPQTLYIIFGYL